ncbi:hypothetical protein SH139x_004099 [Planctomycetaceae bacterium SH139]
MRRYLLALPFAAASSLFTAIPFALAQDEEQGERPARPAPPAWLAALDVDGNGEISADELAQASESLGKLDANDDGVLQMNELQPRPNRRGPGGPRGPRDSQTGGGPWNGPDFQGRGPEGDRFEGRGPGMRRGPGGPGMEGRGPEGGRFEGRGPGMRGGPGGPGGPGMEGRGPEGRGPGMRRGPGGPGMEGRGPEGRGPGMRRGPGGPGMEERGPGGPGMEERGPGGPGMEERGPGGPGMEERGPEGRGPGMRGPGTPPKFEDVDANQDGVIDREEFDKAVRAMHPGGPPRERAERGPGRGAGERPRRDRAPQQPPADSPIELDAEQNDVV